MQIDDIALCEFASLYEAEFEERLSTEEVAEMAHRVLMLYERLVMPPDERRDQGKGEGDGRG